MIVQRAQQSSQSAFRNRMYIIVQQQIMAASVHIHLMRVLLSYVLLSNALAADASPTAPAPKFDKLRSLTSACEVNEQVEIIGTVCAPLMRLIANGMDIIGGQFYMGSQYYFGDKVRSFRVVTCGIDNLLRKIMAAKPPDGANARRQRTVQSFHIDRFAVSNAQFDCFVQVPSSYEQPSFIC